MFAKSQRGLDNFVFFLFEGCHAREFKKLNSYLEKPDEHPECLDMLKMLDENKISFFPDYTRRWFQKNIFRNTKIRPTTGVQALVFSFKFF